MREPPGSQNNFVSNSFNLFFIRADIRCLAKYTWAELTPSAEVIRPTGHSLERTNRIFGTVED